MKNKFRIFPVLLCCLFLSGFHSIYGSEIFRNLTINDGLAHTDANCITQDNTGLMWIGTNAGLQSYDGYVLRTFDYYSGGYKFYQSHNRITVVESAADKLWLGTESGLTCFDLNIHRYIPYLYNENEDGAFQKDDYVYNLLFQPSNRHLWIRNSKGLFAGVTQNDSLRILEWDNQEDRDLCRNTENLQIQGEDVWASAGVHLLRLGYRKGKACILERYKVGDLFGKDERIINMLSIGRNLYMRTAGGCYKVPVNKSKLKASEVSYVDFLKISPKLAESRGGKFAVHKDNVLWCAYSGGLVEIQDPFSQQPVVRDHLENTKGSELSKLKATALFIDKYDNLWVTLKSWGVFYRTLSNYSFKNISNPDFQKIGFSRNEISAVAWQNDAIWMLVEYGSLFRYDVATEKLTLVSIPGVDMESRFLQTLCMSKDNRHLYIGTNQGTIVYDTQGRNGRELKVSSQDIQYKMNTSIAKIAEDNFGRIWIATWGAGLICVESPASAPIVAAYLDMNTSFSILSNQIADVRVNGTAVYVCTVNGLNRIKLLSSGSVAGIASYQANKSLQTSMSTNYLASIDCQNDSVCWIGTIGGGLNKLVLHSDKPNDYTATCYTTQNGLTGNDCEIVFIDEAQNVWIGGNGITRLDTKTGRIYTYGVTNGLLGNAFKMGAGAEGADGTLYMGGLYGLSYFNPSQILQTAHSVELVFTDLIVNNEEVIPRNTYNDDVVLQSVLNNTTEFSLNYKQNNFSVSFAALGYELSGQVMYRYRLKGFQDSWQVLPYTSNQVYYSNLPYGKYSLDVQVSTDKGYSWQESGRSLQIAVLPPWWLTIWAKIAYTLIGLAIVLLALYQYNKEQNLKRENEIQKIIMAKDEEKYESKMQFFMNASHELKTPLTLILLSAEQLLTQSSFAKECRTIFTNTKKMLSLITELVDIRKVDLGLNTLSLSSINVSQLTRQLFDEVGPWAEKKHIGVSFQSAGKEIVMDADKDKVGKLIINLFSNAVKYTDEGGSIEISLKEGCLKDVAPRYSVTHVEGKVDPEQPACILTVKDTGVGISQESIRLIYERFFQVKEESLTHLGSGIGLAIVKGVVLQHGGTIIASSERGVGTEFIVVLPIYHAHNMVEEVEEFDAKNFISGQYSEYSPLQELQSKEEMPVVSLAPERSRPTDSDLPTLLIVEDNKELQMALEEHLSPNYRILIADNGRIGLEMCETLYPDIIISDVMMPEMDGIEMCRRIKNNLSVAYIPIVMLTAKSNVESQIEGYESGADLYLPKPFSIKLLEVNLCRLLTQREQWFKEYRKPAMVAKEEVQEQPAPVSITSEFERRLKKVINENISNSDFSMDSLATTLGMSRTKLYSKVKEVFDEPLSDYIRNLRLEKAAALLVSSELNVAEVMNETGFINSSHFSKIFRMKYGVPPSDYKGKCGSL